MDKPVRPLSFLSALLVNNDLRQWLITAARRVRAHFDGRRQVYVLAFGTLFLGGLAISVSVLNLDLTARFAAWIVLDLIIFTPLAVLITALGLKNNANILKRDIRLREAFTATSAGVVAEVAPVPGGLVARGAALMSSGAKVGEAGAVLVANSVLGMAVAVVAASIAIWADQQLVSIVAGVVGTVAAAASVFWAVQRRSLRTGAIFAALKLAGWAVFIIRIKIALLAIGAMAGFDDLALFGVSGAFGSLASFAPGGLGLPEGLAAVFAAVNDFSPAAAFLAMAINRLVGLAFCGGWLWAVFTLGRRDAANISSAACAPDPAAPGNIND